MNEMKIGFEMRKIRLALEDISADAANQRPAQRHNALQNDSGIHQGGRSG